LWVRVVGIVEGYGVGVGVGDGDGDGVGDGDGDGDGRTVCFVTFWIYGFSPSILRCLDAAREGAGVGAGSRRK
jgi:hypothetical protein